MNALEDILSTFKSNLETNIPDLLSAKSVDALDDYITGPSRDPDQKLLCIYLDEPILTREDNRLSGLCQIQLPGISHDDAVKYCEVLLNYLYDIDLELFGLTEVESVKGDIWPNEQTSGSIVFIEFEYYEPKDDCD